MTRLVSDERLRKAYADVLARRTADPAVPDVPVEVIHALAEGRYDGADRNAKLEAVLAHPKTAAEFQFFLDLARERPAESVRRIPRWLQLAAALVLVAGATLLLPRAFREDREPVRGAGADVELVIPVDRGALAPGSRVVWRPAAGAESYRIELVDADGNVVFMAEGGDTSAVLPDSTHIVADRGYQVWVTARLGDGTEVRSSPHNVVGAPR